MLHLVSLLFSSTVLLRLDGVISFTFGAATALYQSAIFSTAVDLSSAGVSGRGDSLMESALLTLSGYYLLVGALLIALSRLPGVWARRLCIVVALHHGFMALKGLAEADRPWLTGNPWWDIAIHAGFTASYIAVVLFAGTIQRHSLEGAPSR